MTRYMRITGPISSIKMDFFIKKQLWPRSNPRFVNFLDSVQRKETTPNFCYE